MEGESGGISESPAIRQRNELEALQAIYYGCVHNLRAESKIDENSSTHVRIQLCPLESSITSEVHVGVDLVVSCPVLYPDVIPDIRLMNAKGVANVQLADLQKELVQLAKKRVGEVMIHELCQRVQEFLHAYNKPPTESFYQQMITNRKQREKKEAEERQKNDEQQLQMIEAEMKRQREGLREDAKRRRQSTEAQTDRHSASLVKESGRSPTRDAGPGADDNRSRSVDDRKSRSQSVVGTSRRGSNTKRSSSSSTSSTGDMTENSKGLESSEVDRTEEGSDDDDDEDYIPFMPSSDSSSRLQQEFKCFKRIGKGAYGDVIKARNRLDGRLYAIKRIPLNLARKQLMIKITREVKLLSRLNHENVVRYFTSWLETTEQSNTSGTGSVTSVTDPSLSAPSVVPPSNGCFENGFPTLNSIVGGVDQGWGDVSSSMIEAKEEDDAHDESDESDDEVDGFLGGTSFRMHRNEDDDDDDFIIFEGDDKKTVQSGKQINETSPSKRNSRSATSHSTGDGRRGYQKLCFLYIQMEFCEKMTLQDCIFAGRLYLDTDRTWQLFREIIEGLQHIHDQGMIHRDLKPVNVFLDSQGHCKIGDFGLATMGMIPQPGNLLSSTDAAYNGDDSLNEINSSLTGTVGTALYVAPEVVVSAQYNQKVDLYSLGVMFFEMCHRPMCTGMERIKVLNNLRLKTIVFPDDFDQQTKKNQVYILRWLLNHDPCQRPTCRELLKSDYLPPPPMEESECNDILRKTISAPNSRAFRRMVTTIFSQTVPSVTEFGYDVEAYKPAFKVDHALVQRFVTDSLERIFQRHGAVQLTLPLLTPKNSLLANNDTYVCLMDHSGGLVSLPYDPKVSFARYISRTDISSLKRYNFERVFRENRLSSMHPRELFAVSFDIVVPPTATVLLAEAEVLRVIHETVEEFSAVLGTRSYRLHLNHASVLRGILLHCEIPETLHSDVFNILGDSKIERHRIQHIQTRLRGLGLVEKVVEYFYTFLERQDSYPQIKAFLCCITKTKGQAASLVKEGLHELETLLSAIETLACKFQQPIVDLGLVINIYQYSGTLFQVVCDVKNRNRVSLDVLAVGGRYDNLLAKFRIKPSLASIAQPSAVGVTIAYDKIVSAVEFSESNPILTTKIAPLSDVLICSVGHRTMIKEQLQAARELWDAGVSVQINPVIGQNLEDVKEFCRTNRISHLVVQKDTEISIVKVQISERDKVVRKAASVREVVDYFEAQKIESSDLSTSVTAVCKSQTSIPCYNDFISSNSYVPTMSSVPSVPNYNITYIMQESSRPAKNTKRLYENQIVTSISSTLPQLNSKYRVEVLAVELNASSVRTLASHLDLSKDEATFQASVVNVTKELPKYKKYLPKITNEILDVKFEINCPNNVIILYSLIDDMHKLLL